MSLPVSWDVSSLTYNFLPTTSLTAEGPIVLNFPLSITGTDIASGQSFEYGYTTSTQTVSAVVPIPAATWLFGSGLLGLIGVARRKAA
ncbi:MAG: VPLPA-CTERM sorting domain-containing protein [Gammaproteobacteria bacterium]|nr:VPLPA-CTERM sorting domain-containing protein [Gammaproteobacteria bacterium]